MTIARAITRAITRVISRAISRIATAATLPTLSLIFAWSPTAALAQSCPFDDGNSSQEVQGLILTRYALGLTGAPLVAHTGIDASDAGIVEATLSCPSCGLNITGNPAMTVADATIISRKLAGFSGAALTDGLALGSGTRNSAAAVAGFLLSGCGVPSAFVQGGNAFGAPAVIGTTDAQPLKVVSGGSQLSVVLAGGSGLRIIDSNAASVATSVNAINGSSANLVSVGMGAATIAGGGTTEPSAGYTAWGNYSNRVTQFYGVVGGGIGNSAAFAATVPGGTANVASGDFSFAAGLQARATHPGSFVWSDSSGATSSSATYASNGIDTFNVRATGGVYLHPLTSQFFGSNTRQMLNLWGTQYGIGVQSGTTYFRADTPANSGSFSWHSGGTHNDGANQPGSGGQEQMRLDSSANLRVRGSVTALAVLNTSDRNAKTLFETVNTKSVLASVVALPISQWVYRGDEKKTRHLGPMAQDFKRLFNVGQDDKTIATVDAAGVALAAIQGLNLKLAEAVKAKDAEITQLTKKLAAIERRLGM